MSLLATASQTAGPYVHIGFERLATADLAPPGVTGERITVAGRIVDGNGQPFNDGYVEIWQANAAGRYRHESDQHDAPLDPNFTGCGHTLTDADGRYRFVTIRPGAYPWRNHHNAWRPAHIHFSLFGTQFTQRMITQMYFPGDQLLALERIAGLSHDRFISAEEYDRVGADMLAAFNSRDEAALQRLNEFLLEHTHAGGNVALLIDEAQDLSAELPEPTAVDDLRTIAVSRLLLGNIPHIKAYWVSMGVDTAQVALRFGADWVAQAPRTCAAFQAMLPFRNRLVQARWSGEAAWIPLGEPSTVPTRPLTAGPTDAILLRTPVITGAMGPRTSTIWFAPDPSKVIWMTRSSTASPVLSILSW